MISAVLIFKSSSMSLYSPKEAIFWEFCGAIAFCNCIAWLDAQIKENASKRKQFLYMTCARYVNKKVKLALYYFNYKSFDFGMSMKLFWVYRAPKPTRSCTSHVLMYHAISFNFLKVPITGTIRRHFILAAHACTTR